LRGEIEMLQEPMDVLQQHPIRKSKKQKATFRQDVTEYAKSLGYDVNVETKGSINNVVIGDPKTAKYLITAHYDTPAGMLIPNLITPCNFWLFLLYQIAVTVLIFLPSILANLLLRYLGYTHDIAFSLSYILLCVSLLFLYFGPANKNNANDNTSGVVTVLETAKSMPENLRERVCFVLFDQEELGLLGSSAYRKAHKKQSSDQIVLNLDCVGEGNDILFFPTAKLKKNKSMLTWLKSVQDTMGQKSITIRDKGFSVYPSDQAKFPYGVGICALRRNKLCRYLSRIHTNRDTILEETNVNILRACLTTLVSTDAVQ